MNELRDKVARAIYLAYAQHPEADWRAVDPRMKDGVWFPQADAAIATVQADTGDTITTLRAEVAALREGLAFYADKSGWNQPPVKTIAHELFGPAYENQASKIRLDRGKIARALLEGKTND